MGWLDVGWLREVDVIVEAVWAYSGNAGAEVDVLVRVAVEVVLVLRWHPGRCRKRMVGMRGVGIVVDRNYAQFLGSL